MLLALAQPEQDHGEVPEGIVLFRETSEYLDIGYVRPTNAA